MNGQTATTDDKVRINIIHKNVNVHPSVHCVLTKS
jgi:hypothetical protein